MGGYYCCIMVVVCFHVPLNIFHPFPAQICKINIPTTLFQYTISMLAKTSFRTSFLRYFNLNLREGFKKKKYGIFHKGGGVPPDFGSVSILFFLFLNMV